MKLETIIINSKGVSHCFIYTGKAIAIRQVAENLLKTSEINAHPNILWIDSEQKKVNIDEIRGIKDFMYRTTYHSDLPKLIVITSLNNLNLNSLSALLKLIEEPTANTYFILLSHNIESLPSTIRSRSIVINSVPQDDTAIDLTLYNQLLDLLQSTSTKLYKFIEKNFSNLEQLEIFQSLIMHVIHRAITSQFTASSQRKLGSRPNPSSSYEPGPTHKDSSSGQPRGLGLDHSFRRDDANGELILREITHLLSNAKTFGLDPKTVVLIVLHKLKTIQIV